MTKHIYSHLTTKRMLGKITLFTCLFLCLTLCRKHIDFKDAGTWKYLSDKRTIEGYTRVGDKIYGGHYYGKSIWDAIKPMEFVDAETFCVCVGSKYAKDKNHVYYPLHVICEDADEFGGCYFAEYIVSGVRPSDFRYLGNGYGTDGYDLFLEGEKVPWSKYKGKTNLNQQK
ncbi:MAG: DKNYY domain-containing protein [Bacteroidaceae bacterium]|nr:DKNYY domain-containing protein [Bacteroidaceae bacterium]